MIIGISGKPRRGKDSLAIRLRDQIGADRCKILHWADALYAEVSEPHDIFSDYIPTANLTDLLFFPKFKPIGCVSIDGKWYMDQKLYDRVCAWGGAIDGAVSKPGHVMEKKDPLLLQWWGTEYRRTHFGEDYWINKMEEKLASFCRERAFIIADTRFINEADWIKDNDGLLVRIDADEPFEDTGRDDSHPAETQLDDYRGFDLRISNNYQSEFFVHAVNIICDSIEGKFGHA